MAHLQGWARSDRRNAPTRASGSARLNQQGAPGTRAARAAAWVYSGLTWASTSPPRDWSRGLPNLLATLVGMTAVPLGDARDRLSEYVSEVERTHQRVTITRHGHPAAVLISVDDLAAIEETLEILGTPGAVEAINEGLADAGVGRFADNDALKSRYGIA